MSYSNNLLEDNSIKNYLRLYEEGISIHKLNNNCLKNTSSLETYNILKLSNTDIRIIDRNKVYKLLTRLTKIKYFIKSNRYFYMIPIQTIKGTIVGFILRNLINKKSYTTILPIVSNIENLYKKVPFMFGFYKDFKDFDSHNTCKPIIVCEGVKDCIYLKQFYPYVLSNNTSSLGFNSYILRNMTNKIILAYDNDKTGINSNREDRNNLIKLNCSVEVLDLVKYKNSAFIKDSSTLIDPNYKRIEKDFKNELFALIKKFDR